MGHKRWDGENGATSSSFVSGSPSRKKGKAFLERLPPSSLSHHPPQTRDDDIGGGGRSDRGNGFGCTGSGKNSFFMAGRGGARGGFCPFLGGFFPSLSAAEGAAAKKGRREDAIRNLRREGDREVEEEEWNGEREESQLAEVGVGGSGKREREKN